MTETRDFTDIDIPDIDSGIDTDAITNASAAVAQGFQKRVAKEILAAWMAGYQALDVVVDPAWPAQPDADPKDLLTVKAAFVPSYVSTRPTGYPQEVNVTRYDLSDLGRAEADRLRDRLDGDADA